MEEHNGLVAGIAPGLHVKLGGFGVEATATQKQQEPNQGDVAETRVISTLHFADFGAR
jgi:hypothetical protein